MIGIKAQETLLGNFDVVSAIKLDGGKINYYDFLMSAEEPECNAALQRMVPTINLEQIKGFIVDSGGRKFESRFNE